MGDLQALFDIQVPESRGGGLIDRSEWPLSLVGGGSFEVSVEIDGSVCVECGGFVGDVVSHGL